MDDGKLIQIGGGVDHTRPHQDDGVCGECRQPLLRGHRVVQVFIVDCAGRDPLNISRKGTYIFREYELAHKNCKDPFLIKG